MAAVKKTTTEERFWRRVRKTSGCWLFEGNGDNGHGYHHMCRSGRDEGHVYVHRFSYEIHHGPIPDGLEVMHSCDVRNCVNPAHLSVGTRRDNIVDMIRKNRHSRVTGRRGAAHPKAKLTEADVRSIRRRFVSGRQTNARSLSVEYGVTRDQIGRIARRDQWRSLH